MSDYGPSTPNVTPSTPEGGYGAPQKSGGSVGKVILIIVIVFVVLAGLPILFFVLIFSTVWKTATSLIDGASSISCTSSTGSFSIYYDGNEIKGTSFSNMDENSEISELKSGIESARDVEGFLKKYVEKYEDAHSGSKCEISTSKLKINIDSRDDEDEDEDDSDDNFSSNPFSDDTTTASRQIVGNAEYGYVEVPTEWIEFRDVDGNDSVQYSDVSGTYIMSLNVVKDTSLSAEQIAKSYAAKKNEDSDVRGVTGATVKVGKNGYTAYQVYMYYPSDGSYLVTYWFEANDGKVHYLSIEGGDKLAEYTWIADSYRETK